MAGILDMLPNAGILNTPPNNGGLNATNYPNPWGLRAYPDGRGGYGGQMMPKYIGWLGALNNIAYPDSVSTELSTGDEQGDFPAMTPNLSKEQLKRLLSLKEEEKVPQDIWETARQFAEQRRAFGLSPFRDVWDK